jgi:cysteine-rich repeat protein
MFNTGRVSKCFLAAGSLAFAWGCATEPLTHETTPLSTKSEAVIGYGPDDVGPLAGCTNTTARTNLAYSTRASVAAHNRFDLFPCNPANPIVVFLHGGAWRGGDKANLADVQPSIDALRTLGYNVISANYRLVKTTTPKITFSHQMQDIKCLMSHLAQNAAANSYGNPQKLVLWGHSAGGHLALMNAYTSTAQFGAGSNCGSTSTAYRVIRAIASSAPIDLTTATDTPQAAARADVQALLDLGTQWFTTPSGTVYDTIRNASPLTYATSTVPETLTLTAENDPIVPAVDNSLKLNDAFVALDRTDKWVHYPNLAHNSVYTEDAVGTNDEADAPTQITNFLTPPPGCGDGIVTFPEVCDDGNALSCGTCSANCMSAVAVTPATGSIVARPCGAIPDGTTLTLNDGRSGSIVFEVDRLNNGVGNGRVRLACTSGSTASATATSLAQGINAALDFGITATASGTSINLVNDRTGSPGNVSISTSRPEVFTVSGMSGGSGGANCGFDVGCMSTSDCAWPLYYCYFNACSNFDH